MKHHSFFSAFLCLSLAGAVASCTTVSPLNIPSKNTSAPASISGGGLQSVTLQANSGMDGLSPRLRKMVQYARQQMQDPAYAARLRAGETRFEANGDFRIQANRAANNKMYAIGGRGLDTVNGMDRIYEYNPTTHTMTEVGATDLDNGTQLPSAAVAKHPGTGQVYYLESYNGNRRLAVFDPVSGTRTVVGNTNLSTDTVQLTFNKGEELYALDGNQQLYLVNAYTAKTTPINMTSLDGKGLGAGSGDIAFYVDDKIMYRVDGSGKVFEFNLGANAARQLGTITGMASGLTVAGLGTNPNGELLVLAVNQSTSTSLMYRINQSNFAATLLQTYGDSGKGNGKKSSTDETYPLADLSSAHDYGCPAVSDRRPVQPTLLFNDNFSIMPTNFGNLPWENNPDTTSGWRQWNGDYFPVSNGVKLFNPGPYDPRPGGIDDPNNDILGIRKSPGEYEADRQNLLETSIARSVQLKYDPALGDKVKAKVDVNAFFEDGDSDATLMLCFDDPAQTVAVSSTLRGVGLKDSQLYVETEIPACATKVTVIAMGYLGQNEPTRGSVTFKRASLEFIPGNYYTSQTLLEAPFNAATTHPIYGENFPADMDERFGAYNLYLVNNWPVVTGDKAVTAANPKASTDYGGLVKRVNLPAYTAQDTVSAKMYVATTFSDPASEVSLLVEYFDASDRKLATRNAQPVNIRQHRWIEIDRASIPAGATYLKVVPIVKMGANESASFLWDNLTVRLFKP